jgi:hypothetical protein
LRALGRGGNGDKRAEEEDEQYGRRKRLKLKRSLIYNNNWLKIVAVSFASWGDGQRSSRTHVKMGEKPPAHYPHYARKLRRRLGHRVD